MSKPSTPDEYRTMTNFNSLRKVLLEERYADRLDKPLAYWALPNDRRLPIALLGRSIKELLDTPFEELSSTPGIGQKKITTLLRLLSRATKDQPPAADTRAAVESPVELDGEASQPREARFDPAMVSEALWTHWRATVRRHNLAGTKLGRLAPTLQELPTVIWHTPLEKYLGLGLAEIHRLKTYGAKRVRVVLEVFAVVQDMLAEAGTASHLDIRLALKFISPVESWIAAVLDRKDIPTEDEVRTALCAPLLNQVHIDTGDIVHELAVERLGMDGSSRSVREQSRRLNLTRARVYQLLEQCGRVMEVRWPEGRCHLAVLREALRARGASDGDLRLLATAVELFFPDQGPIAEDAWE